MISSNDTLLAEKPDQPIQTLPIDAVYRALATEPAGLAQAEAEIRLQRFGPNALREVAGTPLVLKLFSNFTHFMAILLWIGGFIAFFAQLPQLAIAIWLVNLINGAFSFWQEYKAERATAALRRLMSAYAHVIRDGIDQRIPAENLVPGDLLLLSEGDRVAADGRLVEEAELRIDQSTLTGEAHPVRKTSEADRRSDLARVELPNLVFAGTSVVAGTGRAVVCATGMQSEFGKIAGFTQSVGAEPSPLQQELRQVTRAISAIAISAGVVFFVLAVLLARINLAEGFIFALGMIVAFVPEGLLPTVTLALALGVQRMAHRHALIKRLSAVETLGCTTVICTDKTGTLTQNEMTVRSIWLPEQHYTVTGVGYAPEGAILTADSENPDRDNPALRQLLIAAGLCNNARLLPPNDETARWTVLGDPTEAALLVAARKGGIDLAAAARQIPRIREIPFESRRKRMSTLHQMRRTESSPSDVGPAGPIAYVKGAPKEVLALCTAAASAERELPLDAALRCRIMVANDEYARAGLRVLAIARRTFAAPLATPTAETVESDLTFLGLIAMMDPPRPEVQVAVEKCHHAGIRIVMITGDYGLTAESIARRIGIIRGEQPRIITGADLETLDDTALQTALQDEVIFARVAPEHKLRVVSALQALGQIVAVTGDGVNDAPALKKADIGVAMGITGTDVAKEAADMILTDDNFASIVNAVEEGRAVYANIKKFTAYIFTSNTPEAVPFIIFAFSQARIPLALNVMHILAIDLGTDMVPALALGAEPPAPGVMDQPPRSLNEHVISRAMLIRAYLWLGSIQSLAAMAAFYFQYWTHGYWGHWIDLPASGTLYQSATAMALAAVVITQIGNLFAQRAGDTSIFRIKLRHNRLVWIGILSELLLIALIVYVPFLQEVIGTAAFPLVNWIFLLAWMPSLLLIDELRKLLVRGRSKAQGAKLRKPVLHP